MDYQLWTVDLKKTNDKFKEFWKGLAYAVTAFLILEPVWMLTPFVGFLYGSVLNIGFLESSKATSWLLLFVFPTRGFLVPGLVVAIAGITLFLICAFQVYSAKIFKKGMVTTGIYKYLRHPQYTALILAGAGLVMMWGRFIAYLSLFIMIYLYYLLARKEEDSCCSRFGKTYEDYRNRTVGLLPGMDFFAGMTGMPAFSSWPKGMSIFLAFLLTAGLALGSGFTIIKARKAFAAGMPLIQEEMTVNDKKFLVVSPGIPFLDQKKGRMHFRFRMKNFSPDDFFLALKSSERIRDQLAPFCEAGMNTVLLIFEPRLSVIKEQGNIFFDYYMVPMHADTEVLMGRESKGLSDGDRLSGTDVKRFIESRQVLGLLRIEKMQSGDGAGPVKGDIRVVTVKEVREDEAVRARVENKVDVLLSRFY